MAGVEGNQNQADRASEKGSKPESNAAENRLSQQVADMLTSKADTSPLRARSASEFDGKELAEVAKALASLGFPDPSFAGEDGNNGNKFETAGDNSAAEKPTSGPDGTEKIDGKDLGQLIKDLAAGHVPEDGPERKLYLELEKMFNRNKDNEKGLQKIVAELNSKLAAANSPFRLSEQSVEGVRSASGVSGGSPTIGGNGNDGVYYEKGMIPEIDIINRNDYSSKPMWQRPMDDHVIHAV